MSKYLTVMELAERWKISPSAIYMCRGGTGPLTRIRIGKLVRFLLSEVEAIEAEKIRKAKKAA
jgi:predicted DNA-binding transcriptional regulator AlpA